jgi:hypothetical protein
MPGYDEEIINGNEFTFHNVIETRYYSLKLDSVSQGTNKTSGDGYKAVIDSGTSVLVGPAALVNPLINGITVNDDCSGIEKLPDLTFTIDGIDYVLTYNDYVLQVESDGQKECVLGIMGGQFPPTFKYFILGDSFMRRYYSFFDKKNNRVGFMDTKKMKF